MKCLPRVLAVMAVSISLAACGQKGPLVLPDAPKKKRTLPTTPNGRRATDPNAQPEPAPQAAVDAAPTPTPPEEPATASPH